MVGKGTRGKNMSGVMANAHFGDKTVIYRPAQGLKITLGRNCLDESGNIIPEVAANLRGLDVSDRLILETYYDAKIEPIGKSLAG